MKKILFAALFAVALCGCAGHSHNEEAVADEHLKWLGDGQSHKGLNIRVRTDFYAELSHQNTSNAIQIKDFEL